MGRILFVCAGNTCRSPMAAVLARHYLGQMGILDVEVQSAGEVACGGEPATPEAREAMAAYGLDLSEHRARALDEDLVAGADLVLTMTLGQRDRLRRRWPDHAGKIYALKEYAAGADADADRARLLSLVAAVAAAERERAGETNPEAEEHLVQQTKELEALTARVRGYDITDPLGKGAEVYRRCAEEIAAAVAAALSRYLGTTQDN